MNAPALLDGRRRRGVTSLLGGASLSGLLLACASAPPATPSPVAALSSCPSASPSTSVAPPPGDRAPRRIALTLSVTAEPSPLVHVELAITAPEPELTELVMLDAEVPPTSLAIRDQTGPLDVALARRGAALATTFSRPVSPPLHLAYDVQATDVDVARPLATRVDPNQMRVSGEAAMLFPAALDEHDVELVVAIDTGKERTFAEAGASSFGFGKLRAGVVRAGDLRHATFLAGPIGHATFDGYDGHDEAAWVGYTSFDPRFVAAETAAARTTIDQYFGVSGVVPFTVLLLSGKRPDDPVSVALRSRSLLVTTHLDAPWGARARMAVGRELTHRWLGGRLVVQDPGDPPRISAWLSEGVGRHVTRESLLALGTLTLDDVADDVNATLALEATSPHRGKSAAALAATTPDDGATALAMVRGSLWALAADAALRTSSKGQKTLREPLRALVKLAEERRTRALGLADWDAALAPLMSAADIQKFHTYVLEGKDLDLPADALGACFRREDVRHPIFELGFVPPKTFPGPATHVRAGGPAAKAGLREGEQVTALTFEQGATAVPVVVTVTRGEKPVPLTYRPAGATRPGRAFTRIRAIPEERCSR